MSVQIFIRRKTVVNTDPQRRCYNGCNYSERIEYSEWEPFQVWSTMEFAERVMRVLRCERNEFKALEFVNVETR